MKQKVSDVVSKKELGAIFRKHHLTSKEEKLVRWIMRQWGPLKSNQRLQRIQILIRTAQRYGKAPKWENATLEIIEAFNARRNGT